MNPNFEDKYVRYKELKEILKNSQKYENEVQSLLCIYL